MIQLPKKYLPIIIAGVLGFIATLLINFYIQQQTEEAKRRVLAGQKMMTSVIIAKRDIPAGTMIEEDMLREETVRREQLQPSAATTVARVLNKIAMAPIAKGEQVLLNKITISGQEVSLSAKVPRGKRALTIPVDNIASVGGMLRPGDHVDILGMVPIPQINAEGKQVVQMSTIPLFQDVLILAVGQEYTSAPSAERSARAAPTITFALTPEEANLVAFVQEQGRIRLVLRSPEDTKIQPPVPATWEMVLRAVMPDLFKERPVEQPKPKKTVEIIRGLNKEVKELEDK